MKPNFSLTREAIFTLVAILLIGIAILVSIVLLAFLFSGNASELKTLLLPTRVPRTAVPWIPSKATPIPTTASTSITPTATFPTADVRTVQTIFSPAPDNEIQTPGAMIPTPDYSEALAEIGVLDTSRSGLFGTSLKIQISVHNFGKLSFILSKSNVTLTQPDGTQLTLKSSNPDLPQEIQPGDTETIELDFEMPSSPTATLTVLTVEYDIEGY